MKSVAFLTYNTVGDGQVGNGWHGSNGRRAFLLQNTRGKRWGARRDPNVPSGSMRTTDEYADRVRDEIGELWTLLEGQIAELDHVVIYVGANGSERAIGLASRLPADKVTFVGCDCNLPYKEMLVRAAGMTRSRRILCECGGHRTMGRMFETFMDSGSLLPATAA